MTKYDHTKIRQVNTDDYSSYAMQISDEEVHEEKNTSFDKLELAFEFPDVRMDPRLTIFVDTKNGLAYTGAYELLNFFKDMSISPGPKDTEAEIQIEKFFDREHPRLTHKITHGPEMTAHATESRKLCDVLYLSRTESIVELSRWFMSGQNAEVFWGLISDFRPREYLRPTKLHWDATSKLSLTRANSITVGEDEYTVMLCERPAPVSDGSLLSFSLRLSFPNTQTDLRLPVFVKLLSSGPVYIGLSGLQIFMEDYIAAHPSLKRTFTDISSFFKLAHPVNDGMILLASPSVFPEIPKAIWPAGTLLSDRIISATADIILGTDKVHALMKLLAGFNLSDFMESDDSTTLIPNGEDNMTEHSWDDLYNIKTAGYKNFEQYGREYFLNIVGYDPTMDYSGLMKMNVSFTFHDRDSETMTVFADPKNSGKLFIGEAEICKFMRDIAGHDKYLGDGIHELVKTIIEAGISAAGRRCYVRKLEAGERVVTTVFQIQALAEKPELKKILEMVLDEEETEAVIGLLNDVDTKDFMTPVADTEKDSGDQESSKFFLSDSVQVYPGSDQTGLHQIAVTLIETGLTADMRHRVNLWADKNTGKVFVGADELCDLLSELCSPLYLSDALRKTVGLNLKHIAGFIAELYAVDEPETRVIENEGIHRTVYALKDLLASDHLVDWMGLYLDRCRGEHILTLLANATAHKVKPAFIPPGVKIPTWSTDTEDGKYELQLLDIKSSSDLPANCFDVMVLFREPGRNPARLKLAVMAYQSATSYAEPLLFTGALEISEFLVEAGDTRFVESDKVLAPVMDTVMLACQNTEGYSLLLDNNELHHWHRPYRRLYRISALDAPEFRECLDISIPRSYADAIFTLLKEMEESAELKAMLDLKFGPVENAS